MFARMFRRSIALVCCAVLAAAGGSAWAQASRAAPVRSAPPMPREMMTAPPDMPRVERGERASSLSDAIRRVQRSTGGQILGAERVPFDGRSINRIKYMDGRGRVRYMDDPASERAAPRGPRPITLPPPPGGENSGP